MEDDGKGLSRITATGLIPSVQESQERSRRAVGGRPSHPQPPFTPPYPIPFTDSVAP